MGPDGLTGLMYCVHKRWMDMVEAFVGTTRCSPDQKDPEGWTALTISIRDDDFALFQVSLWTLLLCHELRAILVLLLCCDLLLRDPSL